MKRDFTKLAGVTGDEARYLLARTGILKTIGEKGRGYKPLADKCLAMIFEKASTRTRISFEVGMHQLGGYSLFLSAADTQIGRGEPIKDTARVLSRYVDAIMIRTFSQETVEELALWSTIPVINGLSDQLHPCQILADLFTIIEYKKSYKNIKIAYIGDGNNIANSWIEAAILLGLNLSIATPPGHAPDKSLLEKAKNIKGFLYTHDPVEAVEGANVINTDVWVSMGQEKETTQKKRAFKGYMLDSKLLRGAHKDVIVMHCLPAYRNEEISEDVFEQFHEVIFTQAENRMHAQKALIEWLLVPEDARIIP